MNDRTPICSHWLASDGYSVHRAIWTVPHSSPEMPLPKARVLVLHGVQSHGGWYHSLGRTLSGLGFETHFTDRRGSGANRQDRGHTPSSRRLVDDVAEYLGNLRQTSPPLPLVLVGISWGGKLALVTAGRKPDLVDALALICPGVHPKVDVSLRHRLKIALAYLTQPLKTFPIPLCDPALFTDNPDGQTFIASDSLGLRAATATLLAASASLDRQVARIPLQIEQPSLLMLANQDRIVDNARTLKYWDRLASRRKQIIRYPQGHHTLEFELDPTQYARDLATWLDEVVRGQSADQSRNSISESIRSARSSD